MAAGILNAPAKPARPATAPDLSLRGPMRAAALGLLLLVGGLGLWSYVTVISGAVIAQGQVMVKAQAQQLQSLEGGTVKEILVRNGDHVQSGQVLLRFDPTMTEANLGIALSKLADTLALQARLQAEQLGLTQPDFTPPILPFPVPDMHMQVEGQRKIFAARAAVLQGQRDRLKETLAQDDLQLQGLVGQIEAKQKEIDLTVTQIASQQSLVDQGLARQSALTDLRRSEADLRGQLAALEADKAKVATAKRDAELETLQGERSFQEQVVTDLRDATAKVQELTLEIITRRNQLDQMEVRAPMEGVVHEMKATTIGGVVAPGATIVEVIPLAEGLTYEVQVDPRGIDQVREGQEADLVLSSFDPRTTPKLKARVTTIAPDAVTDQRSGRSFYRVDLSVSPSELARIGDDHLMPGMPITAYLATANRSVLSYLLHPLAVQLDTAFRED